MNKVAIIVTLILAMGVAAGSCTTINPPATAPATVEPVLEETAPPEEPASASAPETVSVATVTPTPIPVPPDIPQEVLATWKSEAFSLEVETPPEAAEEHVVMNAAIPGPPKAPQEVTSIWKSEPASVAFPPDIKDRFTLEPNTASGSTEVSEGLSISVIPRGTFQDSTSFDLEEGQWVDVIVFSLDIPVYFNWQEPRAISLKAECRPAYWSDEKRKIGRSGFPITLQIVGEPPSREMSVFGPLSGKPLYENLVTSTEEGTIFITAARIFAWEGAGEYWFVSYNWNRQKAADVTCCVYKLSTTPGWGESFCDAKLQPWLNELYRMKVSGEISEEEYDRAESQWLGQFD